MRSHFIYEPGKDAADPMDYLSRHPLPETERDVNDWEGQKNRPEIKPYYLVKHELYQTKGLLFRCRQIVIPEKLQKQVIIAAHSLGHFGMTRTKQMQNIGSHVLTVWLKTIYPDATSAR